MGGFRISKVGDWARAQRAMFLLSSADLRKPLKAMGEHVLLRVSDAFQEETSPSGEKWKPSERAAARKRGKTLVQTGRLRASVAYEVHGDELHVGTNLVYGAIHNFGGETGRRDARFEMPKRTFLELTDGDRDEFGSIMGDFLGELVE